MKITNNMLNGKEEVKVNVNVQYVDDLGFDDDVVPYEETEFKYELLGGKYKGFRCKKNDIPGDNEHYRLTVLLEDGTELVSRKPYEISKFYKATKLISLNGETVCSKCNHHVVTDNNKRFLQRCLELPEMPEYIKDAIRNKDLCFYCQRFNYKDVDGEMHYMKLEQIYNMIVSYNKLMNNEIPQEKVYCEHEKCGRALTSKDKEVLKKFESKLNGKCLCAKHLLEELSPKRK